MLIENEWVKVKEHFLKISGVQKQGDSIKIKKKMFAMLNKGVKFVLKLPKDRVDELINSGNGQPYDPGNGKIMKEWVIIPMDVKEKWIEYTNEAMKFAKKLAK